MVKVECPKCKIKEILIINDEVIEKAKASPSGITAISFSHEDHLMVVYIDTEGNIRGIDNPPKPSLPSVINILEEIPIPSPSPPDPRSLDRDEWRFLALCDGVRTLREISNLLNIPYGRLRILAQSLLTRGYLENIELKMK